MDVTHLENCIFPVVDCVKPILFHDRDVDEECTKHNLRGEILQILVQKYYHFTFQDLKGLCVNYTLHTQVEGSINVKPGACQSSMENFPYQWNGLHIYLTHSPFLHYLIFCDRPILNFPLVGFSNHLLLLSIVSLVCMNYFLIHWPGIPSALSGTDCRDNVQKYGLNPHTFFIILVLLWNICVAIRNLCNGYISVLFFFQ